MLGACLPTVAARPNARIVLTGSPVGTRWCLDDIVYVVSRARSALHELILPKVESPRGLLRLEEIAAASDRIEALIFGPGDYAAAAGMPQLGVGAIEREYPEISGTTSCRGS